MLKSKRFFLCADANSYAVLTVPSKQLFDNEYCLQLADCSRSISWYFNKDKKSLAKLKKVRDLINDLYAELEQKVANG